MAKSDSPELYHLVYRSLSKGIPTDRDLNDIVERAREKNARANLTGLLLFKDGVFLQILEGRKETVLDLFTRIKLDDRHSQVEVVMEAESSERIFENWKMGLIAGTGVVKSIHSFTPFLQVAAKHGKVDHSLILPMFQSFSREPLFS